MRPLSIMMMTLGLSFISLFSVTAYAQSWDDLDANSQAMLRPLRSTWEQIPTTQRQQWLQHVPRLQSMNSSQRDNAQERMAEWASLSKQQRVQVEQRLKNDADNNAETRNQSWTRFLHFH
ncbi:DUF3106 domain-containing protein [Hydromonas duriensis]|nr:DUF3106 domain-containing protein [Hydromonas duriensis]